MATRLDEWVEVSDGALSDEPPHTNDGKYHWILLANRVRVSGGKSGPRLTRTVDAIELAGESAEDVQSKVSAYVARPGVRLLISGIETNTLPRREAATDALVEGTAAIYQPKG